MNFLEIENSSTPYDPNKIISIINEEFNSLSYKTISNQIKALPQNDIKQLRLFLVAYAKTVEKARISTITKIKKLNETGTKNKLNDIKLNWFSPINHNRIGYLNCNAKPIKSAGGFSKEKIDSSKNKTHLLRLDKSSNSIFSNHELTPKSSNLTTGNVDNKDNMTIVKSKSAKKIFNNSTTSNINKEGDTTYTNELARDIVAFIDEMKNLQCSICKKEPNVSQLKKNFEKKKASLYQDALKIITKPSSPKSSSPLPTNTTASTSGSNKAMNETIATLKSVIDDLKTNSKFITEQLRTEIQTLNEKVSAQAISILNYENILVKHVTAMKSLYKSMKELIPPILDSMPVQTTNSSLEEKFDWYEGELRKATDQLALKKEGDNREESKVHEMIKKYSKEIVNMIRPFISEEESEIDLGVFENDKDNFEENLVISALECLRKYIKHIVEVLNENKINSDKIEKEFNEMKIKTETYKTLLENTVNKITHSPATNTPSKKKSSNTNVIDSDVDFESIPNLKKLNADLIGIQAELLQKLEMKDIEIEKNQETIQSLLQMKKTSPTETDSEVVSSEKYHYLLNLYSTEQDKLNSIKSDYLHLIQDFLGYVQNGDKIKLDLNNLTRVTNNNNTNNGYIDEEIDSNELGRINENDLLTDKDKDGFNYGNRINSRDSRGSNCNSFNRYKNTSIIEKKQIATLKSELKAAKNEIDRVTKKMNDANGILITIGNAIIKLMNEIQMTNQIKEYFILIFRLLTFSEEKIARLFGEKEKNKKNNY